MSVALSTMISRLQSDVAARNGLPSSTQYEQCVKDAVADFSRRAPMQKVATINVVSGTAGYALPDGFSKLLRFTGALNPQTGVLNTAAGLIPVDASFKERVMVQGAQLVIYPTPAYTMARDLWYAAAYVLDVTNVYADMTDEAAAIVMLKAQALALMLQAHQAAKEGWLYSIGDESVSKVSLPENLRNASKFADAQYLESVRTYIGQIGLRGDAPGTFSA